MRPTMVRFLRDLRERVLNTAWQAAGAVLLTWLETGGDPFHADWKTVLQMAGNAAALAVIKGLVAKQVGKSDSASLDPKV